MFIPATFSQHVGAVAALRIHCDRGRSTRTSPGSIRRSTRRAHGRRSAGGDPRDHAARALRPPLRRHPPRPPKSSRPRRHSSSRSSKAAQEKFQAVKRRRVPAWAMGVLVAAAGVGLPLYGRVRDRAAERPPRPTAPRCSPTTARRCHGAQRPRRRRPQARRRRSAADLPRRGRRPASSGSPTAPAGSRARPTATRTAPAASTSPPRAACRRSAASCRPRKSTPSSTTNATSLVMPWHRRRPRRRWGAVGRGRCATGWPSRPRRRRWSSRSTTHGRRRAATG